MQVAPALTNRLFLARLVSYWAGPAVKINVCIFGGGRITQHQTPRSLKFYQSTNVPEKYGAKRAKATDSWCLGFNGIVCGPIAKNQNAELEMTPKNSVPPTPAPIEYKLPLQGKNEGDCEFVVEVFVSIDAVVTQLFHVSQKAGMAPKYPRCRIRRTSRFKLNGLQVRPILDRGSRKHQGCPKNNSGPKLPPHPGQTSEKKTFSKISLV